MFINNVLIGFPDQETQSKISVVSDKKMLFLENAANGNRFKLDSKFIRHEDPIKLTNHSGVYSNDDSAIKWYNALYYLDIDGTVVTNTSTLNPFLLRSRENMNTRLIHLTINTEKVMLLKYETCHNVIATLKNHNKKIVGATLLVPSDVDGTIMSMLCKNLETGKFVKVNVYTDKLSIAIRSTDKLDRKELTFARRNVSRHGKTLTFKYSNPDVLTKYVLCNKGDAPAARCRNNRIYIEADMSESVPNEDNINYDLMKLIQDNVVHGDRMKALTLQGVDLTFEEMRFLKLIYVFSTNEDGTLKCIKSN